ncbi:hypothetical protein EVAR_72915_1 [Eumeta japonica]|uniref:Uncharacterized protein n=1 Tax=Eumeta variegata TaxID=151549 RepID=A0A4C1TS67_EUMVA|nr:hypothetical protein EVAR_72915_1 [Eumeta japonica]
MACVDDSEAIEVKSVCSNSSSANEQNGEDEDQIPPADNTVTLLKFEGTSLHIDSEEAKRQIEENGEMGYPYLNRDICQQFDVPRKSDSPAGTLALTVRKQLKSLNPLRSKKNVEEEEETREEVEAEKSMWQEKQEALEVAAVTTAASLGKTKTY